MARKLRVHYSGAIYHVIVRGNNRENVFSEDSDKSYYLDLVRKYISKYNFEVYGYVLMDNHLHMLIRVDQHPLAKIMQVLQQCYTQFYNKKYCHVGHVFQQRYKAYLCATDIYLLTVLCYIHQNPVRAGIEAGINYAWSSHSAYVTGEDTLVNTDFVLNTLNSKRNVAIKQYAEMAGTAQNIYTLIEDQQQLDNSIAEHVANKPPILKEKQPTWEELIDRIVKEYDIDKELLLSKCRKRSTTVARNQLIREAFRYQICTQAELAKKLQIDPSRVTRVLQ